MRRLCDVAATVTGEGIARTERLWGERGKVDGKGLVGSHIYIFKEKKEVVLCLMHQAKDNLFVSFYESTTLLLSAK